MRMVAVDLVRKIPGDEVEALVPLLGCRGREVRKEVIRKLIAWNPFLEPRFIHDEPREQPWPDIRRFGHLRDGEHRLRSAIQAYVEAGNLSGQAIEALAHLPALRREVGDWLPPSTRGSFCRAAEDADGSQLERQITIIPTYRCNLACPYCLNDGIDSGQLTRTNWRRLLDWAVAMGVRIVLFSGGEPTLHPDFVGMLRDLRARGLRTYFATNGLYGPVVRETIDPGAVVELSVHVREPADRDVPDDYLERLDANLRQLHLRGVPYDFRYNLARPEQDLDSLFALVGAQAPRSVRFSIAIRGKRGTNRYPRDHRLGVFTIRLREIIRRCRDAGIPARFAKPYPVCLFGEETGLTLLREGLLKPVCSIVDDDCTRNVTVEPDLRYSPCYGMQPGDSGPITEVNSWDELADPMRATMSALIAKPTFDDCPACYLYQRALCQGVCLVNKMADAAAASGEA